MPYQVSVFRDEETVPLIWDWPMLGAVLTACMAERCPEVLDEITEGRWSEHKEVEITDVGTFETYVDVSMVPIYYVPWDAPIFKEGRQVLDKEHRFYIASREKPEKRQVVLQKGDLITAFRGSR